MTAPLSGRRAQAARNDELILEAARAVFVADPGAPIAAVAQRAEVGIARCTGATPARRRCSSGSRATVCSVTSPRPRPRWPTPAIRGRRSPASCAARSTPAPARSPSVSPGRSPRPTSSTGWGRRAHELTQELLDRTKAAGGLRAEIEVGDLSLIFEQLQALHVGAPERADRLRHRYLALMLDALRSPAAVPLPGPAPTWQEISRRWEP